MFPDGAGWSSNSSSRSRRSGVKVVSAQVLIKTAVTVRTLSTDTDTRFRAGNPAAAVRIPFLLSQAAMHYTCTRHAQSETRGRAAGTPSCPPLPHHYRPLDHQDICQVWPVPGRNSRRDPHLPGDSESVIANVHITGGNFRLVERLNSQVACIISITPRHHHPRRHRGRPRSPRCRRLIGQITRKE